MRSCTVDPYIYLQINISNQLNLLLLVYYWKGKVLDIFTARVGLTLEFPNSYSEIHDMVNIHENSSSLQTVHLRISFLFLGQYESCLSSSRSGICPEKGIYSSRPQVANQLTLQEVHLQALQTYNVTELSTSLHITRKLTLILKFSKI